MNSPQALHGLGVLVTRPAHQAQGLCRVIREQWASPGLSGPGDRSADADAGSAR